MICKKILFVLFALLMGLGQVAQAMRKDCTTQLCLRDGSVVPGESYTWMTCRPTKDVFTAYADGDYDAVKRWVLWGCDLDATRDSESLLYNACRDGNLELATFLLDHGANTNAKRTGDADPLFPAVGRGRFDIAELLLSRGANIEPQNSAGFTPLYLVCTFNKLDAVKFLIYHGAKPKREDLCGACEGGHLGVVKFLLKKGVAIEKWFLPNTVKAEMNNFLQAFVYWLQQPWGEGLPTKEELDRLDADPSILATLFKRYEWQQNPGAVRTLKQFVRVGQFNNALKQTSKKFQEKISC
jgi:hypothetical protein